MRQAFGSGLGLLRREPGLALALLVAFAAPAILGLLPLDRALSVPLAFRPAARALVEGTADDSLLIELGIEHPALPDTALAGVLVALLIATPACWIVAAAITARALEARTAFAAVSGRGIGSAVILLPLRLVPIGLAALALVQGKRLHHAPLAMAVAACIYALGSAKLSALGDLTRAFAIADPERPLVGALGDALRAALRSPARFLALVGFELLLAGAGASAIALTRPLGIFSGLSLVIGVGALALRAAGSLVGIAAAAASLALPTGAASRSA